MQLDISDPAVWAKLPQSLRTSIAVNQLTNIVYACLQASIADELKALEDRSKKVLFIAHRDVGIVPPSVLDTMRDKQRFWALLFDASELPAYEHAQYKKNTKTANREELPPGHDFWIIFWALNDLGVEVCQLSSWSLQDYDDLHAERTSPPPPEENVTALEAQAAEETAALQAAEAVETAEDEAAKGQ